MSDRQPDDHDYEVCTCIVCASLRAYRARNEVQETDEVFRMRAVAGEDEYQAVPLSWMQRLRLWLRRQ